MKTLCAFCGRVGPAWFVERNGLTIPTKACERCVACPECQRPMVLVAREKTGQALYCAPCATDYEIQLQGKELFK